MLTDVSKQTKLIFKLMGIVILSLILLIPTAFLKDQIRSREELSEKTVDEISSAWGSRQVIRGPFFVKELPKDKNNNSSFGYMLPQEFSSKAEFENSKLKRGIFNIPVYRSRIDISGYFIIKDKSKILNNGSATISMVINDLKGLEEIKSFKLGGYDCEITNNNIGFSLNSELNAYVPEEIIMSADTLRYDIQLILKGAASMDIVPIGDRSRIEMHSDYPTPSFKGAFSPIRREVGKEGFSSEWRINALNKNYGGYFEPIYSLDDIIDQSSVGVEMYEPVSLYQKIERSVKYALLIILLTMTAIFLIEVATGKTVNFLQYILTGADLVIFYTLLLSLSEHIGFGAAFLIAMIMTIGLMIMYMKSVMGTWYRSFSIGGLSALLYLYIYVLLQMGDFAFLAGSLGLFVFLALVMFFSQKALKAIDKEKVSGQVE